MCLTGSDKRGAGGRWREEEEEESYSPVHNYRKKSFLSHSFIPELYIDTQAKINIYLFHILYKTKKTITLVSEQ